MLAGVSWKHATLVTMTERMKVLDCWRFAHKPSASLVLQQQRFPFWWLKALHVSPLSAAEVSLPCMCSPLGETFTVPTIAKSANAFFRHQQHFTLICCQNALKTSVWRAKWALIYDAYVSFCVCIAWGETAIQEFLQTMFHLYLAEVHRFVMQCL